MAGQTGRSLRLSAQGIEKANTALLKFGSKADLAAQLQMSRTTINKFFKGEPVEQKKFRAICKKLKLILEEVANLPKTVESQPFEQNQDNNGDLDELMQEVRSRCCDKIQDQYSKIQLLNLQRIDVDRLYVDVYVLEKLCSESYATIPDLLRDSHLGSSFDRLGLGRRQKRSPGFEVAAQHPRLMILGKPGSGKSTFLRHLAVACCKGEFQSDHIPILIELRDINASEFNLLNHIHQEFDLADEEQTKQILKQGKVVILLDGLDEVPSLSRREVQDHIYKFSQSTQYYKNRFILTCRTQTTEYISDKFERVEVAEFKPEQVELFAQNWFAALAETPNQGEELTAQFLEKLRLPGNKQTAELAVTPILLSLTCWVFNDLKDLPPKRSDLYEQGINLLLEKWDEKRGVRRELGSEAYRKLSIGEKKKLLSYLAARKFEQEQYVLFEQGELQGYIAEYPGISTEDSEAVLNAVAVQHGLLIERAQGFWSFSHLTFQEYFTAQYIVDNQQIEQLVMQHLADKRWQEVFLLVAGLMQDCSRADELLLLMEREAQKSINTINLYNLLRWADEVTTGSEGSFKPAAKRAAAIANAYSDVNGYANAIAMANAIPTAYGNTIVLDLTNNNAIPINRASDLINDLTYRINRACELEKLKIFNNINFTVLIAKLEALKAKVPDNQQQLKSFRAFRMSVHKTWQNALNFNPRLVNLLEKEYEALGNYLYVNYLMIQFKEVAVLVSREIWEKIEARMLLVN